MNIIEKMKADVVKYRRAKAMTEVSILQTFLGEMNTQEKKGIMIDDNYVIKNLKVFIKNNSTTISLLKPEDTRVEHLKLENDFLNGYIPVVEQLTESQIDAILEKETFTSMKDAMSHFKQFYAGQYDGGKLAKLLKGKF